MIEISTICPVIFALFILYWELFDVMVDLSYTLVAPKIAPFDFGSEPSNSGDSASVQCLVTSGDLPLDVKWLFNDRPISEIFGISTVKLGKRTYALTIDSVSAKHVGNFSCVASNAAGVDRYSAGLIVNGIKLRRLRDVV